MAWNQASLIWATCLVWRLLKPRVSMLSRARALFVLFKLWFEARGGWKERWLVWFLKVVWEVKRSPEDLWMLYIIYVYVFVCSHVCSGWNIKWLFVSFSNFFCGNSFPCMKCKRWKIRFFFTTNLHITKVYWWSKDFANISISVTCCSKKKEAFPSLRVQKRVWQLIPKKKSLATGELSENSSTLRFEEPNVREIWRR